MISLTSFTLLPETALHDLRGAARENYHGFLHRHGRKIYNGCSGDALATLLPCLQEEHQIDLMRSDFDDLSAFLTQERGARHFIFTDAHKRAYVDKLNPQSFSEERLRDYYNKHNAASEPEAGKQMLDGVKLLRESLAALDKGSVVVLSIY
jgi:hypothetical protein